ncbi:helix-turn-helix transcriptional regulator [Actinoplanes sp. NPDC051851]|uniref:helix-turn-helix domain-containing protein n=1 Tax=Actinoplanes sp. NPDC051851 TaxID=3154753 RepID=UPI0034203472
MTVDGSPDPVYSPRALLAAELRILRDRTGQTLRELQAATFASDSALSRYLIGRSVPPWQVVTALCAQTGTDPAVLRDLWQLARATRGVRRPPTMSGAAHLEAVRAIQMSVAKSLATITDEVAESIRVLRARGDAVPEHLFSAARSGADAAQRLRTAQRLISR